MSVLYYVNLEQLYLKDVLAFVVYSYVILFLLQCFLLIKFKSLENSNLCNNCIKCYFFLLMGSLTARAVGECGIP
jgi:hypothetical protein